MLVTQKNLSSIASSLRGSSYLGLDTETTGLKPYNGDRLFSIIISDAANDYYFNFQPYEDLQPEWILSREDTLDELRPIFLQRSTVWAVANAKFDLAILQVEGINIKGEIWDTGPMGRILYNRHMKYGLDAASQRIGASKDNAVEEYISKNRIYTWARNLRGEKKEKLLHYDRVPFGIISKYGEKDGRLVYNLGQHQREKIKEEIKECEKLARVVSNEKRLTKVCFDMERIGIRIDRQYSQRGYEYELAEASKAAAKFKEISGHDFVDSGKALQVAFDEVGEKYPTTAKGNPSFTEKVLKDFTSPLAKLVLQHRAATKRACTYYENFLYYADSRDRIHPNMKQDGTDTARFSYSEPNLQNVPKEETGDMKIRSAFIPTSDEWCLVMIDYDQMEYRLLLEYAKEMAVINAILHDGLDVHTATAKMMGVTRTEAKTLNFMLLYGGGAQKLADALGITLEKAGQLKQKYFKNLPGVSRFTRRVIEAADSRGWVRNWAGRRYYFPELTDPRTGRPSRFAYKAPNHIIQGGCADVMRFGLTDVHEYLKDKRSRLLLTIHDEALFEVHLSELFVIKELRDIMEKVYPHKWLPLTCGVDFSFKNWGDKKSIPRNLLENLDLASLLEL